VTKVKKVGGRKLQISDRQLQILDKGDMGAQNFNFAPKSPPQIRFYGPKFCIFGQKIFRKKRTFSDWLNLGVSCTPAPMSNIEVLKQTGQ